MLDGWFGIDLFGFGNQAWTGILIMQFLRQEKAEYLCQLLVWIQGNSVPAIGVGLLKLGWVRVRAMVGYNIRLQ